MMILPDKCMRGRDDCQPYALMASDCETTFFCCGENDGTTRIIEQDKYTLCFKNDTVDQISHNDKRDLTHQMFVIVKALAVIEEKEVE